MEKLMPGIKAGNHFMRKKILMVISLFAGTVINANAKKKEIAGPPPPPKPALSSTDLPRNAPAPPAKLNGPFKSALPPASPAKRRQSAVPPPPPLKVPPPPPPKRRELI